MLCSIFASSTFSKIIFQFILKFEFQTFNPLFWHIWLYSFVGIHPYLYKVLLLLPIQRILKIFYFFINLSLSKILRKKSILKALCSIRHCFLKWFHLLYEVRCLNITLAVVIRTRQRIIHAVKEIALLQIFVESIAITAFLMIKLSILIIYISCAVRAYRFIIKTKSR